MLEKHRVTIILRVQLERNKVSGNQYAQRYAQSIASGQQVQAQWTYKADICSALRKYAKKLSPNSVVSANVTQSNPSANCFYRKSISRTVSVHIFSPIDCRD